MIFDLHNDLPTAEMSETEKADYIRRNEDCTLTLAVWTSRLSDPFGKIKETVRSFSVFPSVRFAVEDAWFVTDENADELSALPLEYCTLAWSGDNALAGGHKGGGGLTELGKRFVKKLKCAGIAVDTAHLNERSFYEVLDAGSKTLCSHTCQYALHPHTRNLTDNQIRALINAGGKTGIAAVADFMGEPGAGIGEYALQICRYAEKFGVESLCIGTDFFGTEPFCGLESYSCFDSLAEILLKRGFSDKEIRDIFYFNANKFFTERGV